MKMYILASVSTWYWCVPWEGSTAGAMELALEHSRHLPGASLRLLDSRGLDAGLALADGHRLQLVLG